LSSYQEALDLFVAANNRHAQGVAFYGLGLTEARLSAWSKALDYYQKALDIFTNAETRDRYEEARTLHAMGGGYDELGQPEQAQAFFKRALEGWRETGDFAQEGNTYSSLAKMEMDQGNWQTALDMFERVVELYSAGEQAFPRRKLAIRRQHASTLY